MRHRAFWFAAFALVLYGQEREPERTRFTSPDNKWEFRVIDDIAALVQAGSNTTVVDLSEARGRDGQPGRQQSAAL